MTDAKPMVSKTTGKDANGRDNYQGVLYNFSGTGDASTSSPNTSYVQGTISYREPAKFTNFDTTAYMSILSNANLYQEAFNKMVESVAKYKGFYVGRYETSLNGSVAQSKSGETPMASINWFRMYENSITYAQNKTGVTSEMIWGCQWDAMLNFILTGEDKSHVTASSNVGHTSSHFTSRPYRTGGTTYADVYNGTANNGNYGDIANNIYDLEGNVREWTQEANNTFYRVSRGGRYGNGYSPSDRYDDVLTDSYDYERQSSRTLYKCVVLNAKGDKL